MFTTNVIALNDLKFDQYYQVKPLSGTTSVLCTLSAKIDTDLLLTIPSTINKNGILCDIIYNHNCTNECVKIRESNTLHTQMSILAYNMSKNENVYATIMSGEKIQLKSDSTEIVTTILVNILQNNKPLAPSEFYFQQNNKKITPYNQIPDFSLLDPKVYELWGQVSKLLV